MVAKQEVTVKKETAVAIPEWMREHQHLGTEKLGAADVEVPRVKLMQKLSPELEEHNDLKAGDFFHTLAELNMGSSLRITPIFIDYKFILWRPQDSGGGILARADDGIHWNPPNGEFLVKLKGGQDVKWRTAPTVKESGLDAWGSSNPADPNSPPAATRMYNMVIGFPDEPDLPPAVVTLQRSSIRVARKFIGKMKITRAPSFGLIFQMRAVEDINAAGQKFYNYNFTAGGMVTDKAEYDNNFSMYNYFRDQGVKVKDMEGLQDDPAPEEVHQGDKPAF